MKFAKKSFVYLFLLSAGLILFVNVILETGVDNIISTLKDFSILYFGIYYVVQFVNFLFLTWRWRVILKHFGHSPNFFNLVLHRFSGWAVSFLTPSAQVGGEPVRVMLLGKDGIRKRDAVFSVIVDKVLQLSGLIIFVLIGFLFLLSRHLVSGDIFWTILLSLVFFIGLLGWFYYASIKGIGFFSSFFKVLRLHKVKRFKKTYNKMLIVEEALRDFYTDHWGKFMWLLFSSVCFEAYEMIEYWLIAHFLGYDMTFAETFLLRSLPCLAFLVPIPAALGVYEGSIAAIVSILGLPFNAFVFAMIVRIRDLINVLFGLSHLSGTGIMALRRYFGDKLGKGWFRKRYWKLFG